MSSPLPTPEGGSPGAGAQAKRHELTVTVYDEDSGETFRIEAEASEAIGEVIAVLYRSDLHRERRPDDRLRCDAGGGDVFAHEAEHIEEYARRNCSELKWTFVGGTGGA